MIGVLVLLPVILALLGAVHLVQVVVAARTEAQRHCRDRLLQGQLKAASVLSTLLELNPKAEYLRTQRILADKAYRLAVDPATKAAARAWRLRIRIAQAQLASVQRGLLSAGRLASREGLKQAQSQLATLGIRSTALSRPSFPVARKYINEDASPHFVPTHFSAAQSSRLEWTGRIADRLSSASPRLLHSMAGKIHFNGRCEATIVEASQLERTAWMARAS